jgi:DNA-binding CsgD family transcriptional regulator
MRLLSGREHLAIFRLAMGDSNDMVAKHLGIAPGGNLTRLIRLACGKLGARSKEHAVAIALLEGIFSEQEKAQIRNPNLPSERELDVLFLLNLEFDSLQIQQRLKCTHMQVKSAVLSVMKKFRVSNYKDAITHAKAKGYFE